MEKISMIELDESFLPKSADAVGNEITYDIANLNDIPELIRLRILYMIDDFGSVSDEERAGMEKQLPDYFERELGKKLVAFVARAEGRLVAAAYLHIIEMPANSILLNGIYGEVLSVYTEHEYRGKGICTKLIQNLIDYGKKAGLGRIDLSATAEGYPIYSKLGFKDKEKRYTDMRYNF
jgi:GNAT superfamily N-acetyltransferase